MKNKNRRNAKPFPESCEIEVAAGTLRGEPIVALRVLTGGEPSRFICLDCDHALVLGRKITDAARQAEEPGSDGG